MGEDGKFDEVEMEWWDRDLRKPTDADIAVRHDLDRRNAEMVWKLRELATQWITWKRYGARDLLHGKPGHVG